MISYKLNEYNTAQKFVDGVATGEWLNTHNNQEIRLALSTGKNADGTNLQLNDANNNVMTAQQVTAFLATLP